MASPSLSKLLPHKHLSESSFAPLHCYFHPRPSIQPFHICPSMRLPASLVLSSCFHRPPYGFCRPSPPALLSTEPPRRFHRYSRLRPLWSPCALGPQLVALSSFPQRELRTTLCSSRPSPCRFPTRPRVFPPFHCQELRRSDPWSCVTTLSHAFHSQRGSLARATLQDLGIKTSPGAVSPEPEAWVLVPPPPLEAGLGDLGAGTMTARGTPSRFLTSVLHNGLGRYVQQLQRLSFSLSRDAPSSRGAR